MSDEALANYIDARAVDGNAATPPADDETQGLVGTVMLAEAGLGTPPPREEAERASREQLVRQLTEGGLPQRSLHTDAVDESFWTRVKRWWNGRR
jgi:hypothetical protein